MRSVFFNIKTILIPVLVIFYGLIWFHDDGIPETLTKADEAYVLNTHGRLEQRMTQVIEEIEQFIAEPERETELCVSLAATVDSWYAVGNKVHNDGRFLVVTAELSSQENRLQQLVTDLEIASQEMAEEIKRRVDGEEYDQDGYDVLYRAFSQDLQANGASIPCSKGKCFWCQLRKILRLH